MSRLCTWELEAGRPFTDPLKSGLGAQLLRSRPDGIFVAPFEQGEIGRDLFRAACRMGLEGMVSKRADRPYRAGRSKDFVKKIRNPMGRAIEVFG
jgi:hypothetical protein